MFRINWYFALLLLLVSSQGAFPTANNVHAARRVLILYDTGGTSADHSGWNGPIDAQMMQNLLNHFKVKVTVKPMKSYRRGDLNRYNVTFYLGTAYDSPLPPRFMKEVMTTTRTICWVNYNIWQIAWVGKGDDANDNPAFTERFGIRYLGIDDAGLSSIIYKGRNFTKSSTNPEFGKVVIDDGTKAIAVAIGKRPPDFTTPYILHIGNLWYVADDPFDEMTPADRYYAFADLLHDILNIPHQEIHRAMIRIEDVHPLVSEERLREVADICKSLNVPFLIAVIPEYDDPLGKSNNGVPKTVRMDQAPAFVETLRYMQACGGQIVMHGYTHQYDHIANPYSGVSADDAEFFRIMPEQSQTFEGTPTPGFTASWAKKRILAGLKILQRCHLKPVAWNTPHYIATAAEYRQFARMFHFFVDRARYFTTDDTGKLISSEQPMPYLLTDVYGCFRIPETLSYIRTEPENDEPTINLPDDMAHTAESLLAVRDGWASFYYHCEHDPQYLKDTVIKLKALGYKFVPLTPDIKHLNHHK